MKLLEGKTAIVTGGGKGIGRAVCAALSEQGANVAIVDIDQEVAELAAGEIERQTGGRLMAIGADVSREDQVKAAVASTVDTFGGLHILINNAGICYLLNKDDMFDVSDAQWDKTFAVNLKGAMYFARNAVPHMIEGGYGRIVNTASQAARNGGIRVSPEYSSSKAAVMCMTKTMAGYYGRHGITVNTVAPGLIKSEMTANMVLTDDMVPLGRIGEPEDVADAVVFLASHLARYVTGTCLDVNGGTVMA